MDNYPDIPEIIAQLAQHKAKAGYTNAHLVISLNTFGNGPWVEDHLDDLFTGRVPVSATEEIYFQRYLLNAFYVHNSI